MGTTVIRRLNAPRPEEVDGLADLRAVWETGRRADPVFRTAVADWLIAEGGARHVWLAWEDAHPIGMASLLEHRRMPAPGRAPSAWGYLNHMFVLAEHRDRGVGKDLLAAIIDFAEARGWARIVLSPAARAVPFYRRAGFRSPGEDGAAAMLVRPARG